MVSRETVESRVMELVKPILDDLGLELYEISFHPAGNRSILRIFVDRPGGGITLAECAQVSRELSAILDVEDPIPHSYTLEVSSPGATRRLKDERDFKRSVGMFVLLELSRPVEGKRSFRGRLMAFEGGEVKIEVCRRSKKGGSLKRSEVRIPYEAISFARLEVREDDLLEGKR